MKRRDFLTKFISSSSCAFGLAVLGIPFIAKASKSCKLLSDCGETSLMIQGNKVILPISPEPYKTMFTLNVSAGPGKLPKISGNGELVECQEEHFQIEKPGVYSLQYLGPFYGWKVS
ncbi:MAG: hypothetical protein ACJAS4_000501 [Bacteriovoracaceae bacterium]|jgi:hypothetical protein